MAKSVAKNGLITALDIGSSKICCLIAKKDSTGELSVLSHAVCQSTGFSNGKINDIKLLENSIRQTLASAEEKVPCKISSVFVNCSAASIKSNLIGAEAHIASAPVTKTDIDKVLGKALESLCIDDGEILHKIPLSYSIDGESGREDPRGMIGKTLGATLNVIYIKPSPLYDLHKVLSNSLVSVNKVVISPYASGLAAISPDEKDIGCTVIDFGAGSIGLAYFEQKKLEYAACIPVGSNVITSDIAKTLSCPMKFAEELKRREGAASCSPYHAGEMIEIRQTGNEEGQVSRLELTNIINERLKEIFRLVRYKLDKDGFYNMTGRRLILTGGGTELRGIKETARDIFDNKQVRIASPQIKGLPSSIASPAFSTVVGLLKYVADADDYKQKENMETKKKNMKFGRIGQWFLQSF